jgi:hypothetical protein
MKKHTRIKQAAINSYSSFLKKEILLSSETSANVYKTTGRHVSEDSILHSQRCANLVSYRNCLVFTEHEPGLTMDEITAQVMVFFMGGFETTSATMSFCLYELAKTMEVQVLLRSEMDAVLKRYGDTITYEAVKEMKYLDRVVSGEGGKVVPMLNYATRHEDVGGVEV